MRACNVLSTAEALDYLTDCTLATVCQLAGLKSRSQYEFNRQKSIATACMRFMRDFGVTPTSRAAEVVEKFGGSVEDWAAQYDVKAKK